MGEKNIHPVDQESCCDNQFPDAKCECAKINRRDFMTLTAIGAAGAALNSTVLPVIAGPVSQASSLCQHGQDGRVTNEYLKTIPIDKKLNPQWLASLTTRGKPTVVTDPAALQPR